MTSDEREKLGADLSAYLDGELSQDRSAEIEQMLAKSTEARAMLDQLRAASQSLRDLPRTQSSKDLSNLNFLQPQQKTRLGRRASVGKTRVYRLITRVSATAALIALCAFAWWSVSRQPSTTERPMAERIAGKPGGPKGGTTLGVPASPLAAATPLEAAPVTSSPPSPEAPQVVMRQLRSLGYVGGEDEGGASEGVESALAARKPTLAPESRVAAAEPTGAVPAAPPPPASANERPEIHVIVAPRNAAEYSNTLLAVNQFQASDRSNAKEAKSRSGTVVWTAPKSGAGGLGGLPPVHAMMAQEITFTVSPDQVNSVLTTLNEQAPRQVQATMSFNTSDMRVVRQMVTPAGHGEEPAKSPQSDEKLAMAGRPAVAKRVSQGNYPRGGVERGRGERKAESATGEAPAADALREKSMPLAKDKSAEAGATSAGEPTAAKKTPLSEVVQLGDRLRGMYEQVFAAVFRGPGDQRLLESPAALGASFGDRPIHMRVTLLPPPEENSATQPVKSDETP